MFLLGHLGIPLLVLALLGPRKERSFSPLLLCLGGILPDLLDKPLSYLLPEVGRGRVWGHTLLFLLVLLVVGALLRREGWGAHVGSLAIGVSSHLLLDRMWEEPTTLLWPFLGPFPAGGLDAEGWVTALRTDPYVQVGEVLGWVGIWIFV